MASATAPIHHPCMPTFIAVEINPHFVKSIAVDVPLLNRTVLPICSIEVSPHGDLLDEQKGSAAGRAAQGRAGRTHHECARGEGAGVERTAVPTTEEALPGGRRPRPAPRPARAAR